MNISFLLRFCYSHFITYSFTTFTASHRHTPVTQSHNTETRFQSVKLHSLPFTATDCYLIPRYLRYDTRYSFPFHVTPESPFLSLPLQRGKFEGPSCPPLGMPHVTFFHAYLVSPLFVYLEDYHYPSLPYLAWRALVILFLPFVFLAVLFSIFLFCLLPDFFLIYFFLY